MSLEIEIPKEIDEYKERLFFHMTTRQLLAACVICAIDIPLYFWGRKIMPLDVLQLLLLVTGAPAAFFGFFTNKSGQKPEQIAADLLNRNFVKQKRIYEELPVFYFALEEIIADELAVQKAKTALDKRNKRKLRRKCK